MQTIYKEHIKELIEQVTPVEGESPLQKLKRLTNYEEPL